MAISWVSGAAASTTTVALPGTAAAGDVAIAAAGRANSSPASIPGGWTTLGSDTGGSGGTQHSQIAGWKILTAGDITAGNIGTWSNAGYVLVGIWRTDGAPSVGSNLTQGDDSNSVTLPAQTGLAATSWQIGIGTHRNSGLSPALRVATVTNYTNRLDGLTSVTSAGIWDSNGTTTGIAAQTAACQNTSGNVGRTVELSEAADWSIDAATSATFSATAVLRGKASIAAAGTSTFGQVNVLKATAPIAASATFVFDATASLGDGSAAVIAGYVTLNAWWTGIGLSSVGPVDGSIAASATLVFASAVSVRATGSVDASTSFSFAAAADLNASGTIESSTSMQFVVAQSIQAIGRIESAASFAFTAAAVLQDATSTAIVASTSLAFASTAAVQGLGWIEASESFAFTATTNLQNGADTSIVSSTSLAFTASADLSAKGAIAAADSFAFTGSTELNGLGSMTMSTTMVFAASMTTNDIAGPPVEGWIPQTRTRHWISATRSRLWISGSR